MSVLVKIHPKFSNLVEAGWISSLVERTINEYFSEQNWQLAIALEDDKTVQQLNKQYRDIDSVTDVLSFEGDYIDPESGLTHLGDIIIAVPQTQKQAETATHSFPHELAMLIIHGILHLKGYDHAEIEEEKIMWKKQEQILQEVLSSLKDE